VKRTNTKREGMHPPKKEEENPYGRRKVSLSRERSSYKGRKDSLKGKDHCHTILVGPHGANEPQRTT